MSFILEHLEEEKSLSEIELIKNKNRNLTFFIAINMIRGVRKWIKIPVFIYLLFLFFPQSFAEAENSISTPTPLLSCEPKIYFIDSSYKLPYRGDGKELVNGSSSVKPGDYLIYSVKLKNYTSQRQIIEKVYIQHLLGADEPISILESYLFNGTCSSNSQDKSIFCLTNYSFQEETNDPFYVLLKINNEINNIPKTSSLFTIKTNTATAQCATYLWLKDEKKKNPINWATPYASLKANDFFIRIGEQKFYGQEPISISSNPGADRTTLEAIWREKDVEMRMFMYFRKKENNMWEMYELRTYNGNNPGDWIYYQESLGNKIESLIGYQNYDQERKFTALNGLDAEVYCRECSINAFLSQNLNPSPEGYILEPLIGLPEGKIITIINDPMVGYGVDVLLKDQRGEIVKNQQGMIYRWEVENSNIAQIFPKILGPAGNNCLYDIQPPCPLAHVDISGLNPGKTVIKIEVIREIDNVSLASASFPVSVVAKQSLPHPELCASEGEVIKKDDPKKCCSSLILVPPLDDRTDIFGTCLKSCVKNGDCRKEQTCSLAKSNQLVCLPKTENNEEIKEIRKDIEKLTQEQNEIIKILNQIVDFFKRLFQIKS